MELVTTGPTACAHLVFSTVDPGEPHLPWGQAHVLAGPTVTNRGQERRHACLVPGVLLSHLQMGTRTW